MIGPGESPFNAPYALYGDGGDGYGEMYSMPPLFPGVFIPQECEELPHEEVLQTVSSSIFQGLDSSFPPLLPVPSLAEERDINVEQLPPKGKEQKEEEELYIEEPQKTQKNRKRKRSIKYEAGASQTKKARRRLTDEEIQQKIIEVEVKLSEDPKNSELKDEKRRLNNQLSARKSRKAKKDLIATQERRIKAKDKRIKELQKTNAFLQKQMKALAAENEKLKQEAAKLSQASRNSLTMSFGNNYYNGPVFDFRQ